VVGVLQQRLARRAHLRWLVQARGALQLAIAQLASRQLQAYGRLVYRK
jgi:hypothetical protein